MATISDLADDVYILTNRPDLVAETKVAIRKAIRKFHGADTFKRDISITRIDMTLQTPLEPNQYRWSLPLDLFTRFRRFKGVNYPVDKMPPINQIPAPLFDVQVGYSLDKQFHEIAPDNLFDGYGYQRQNYFIVTGNTVTVKSGWYINLLDFAYYQWPEIPTAVDVELSSWIVREYPDSIIDEAAGTVFKMIGKDDESQRYQALFLENLAILKATDLGEVA